MDIRSHEHRVLRNISGSQRHHSRVSQYLRSLRFKCQGYTRVQSFEKTLDMHPNGKMWATCIPLKLIPLSLCMTPIPVTRQARSRRRTVWRVMCLCLSFLVPWEWCECECLTTYTRIQWCIGACTASCDRSRVDV
jgi:hypothetical protein